jgi:hypothetical protein
VGLFGRGTRKCRYGNVDQASRLTASQRGSLLIGTNLKSGSVSARKALAQFPVSTPDAAKFLAFLKSRPASAD